MSILEKQLETFNNRLATYQAEHAKLVARVEQEFHHDTYDIKSEIKKVEDDILQYKKLNLTLKGNNIQLYNYSRTLHGLPHHRVTLDDENQLTLNYKHNHKELDQVLLKIDKVK